jgi:hypothetical protein
MVVGRAGEKPSTEESKMQADAVDLKAELDKLQKQAASLYDLWDRCRAFLSEKKYKEAYLKLKESKGDEDTTPEIRNIHAVLSSHIKETWRSFYVGDLHKVITTYPARLDQLRRAAGDISSLEEFNVLSHDGDGLLAADVHSTWHLYEVEDALEMKLDQIQEDQLDGLGARLDWGRILEHLDGLMKYPPNGKTFSQVSLLRPVALGHYGLSLERQASIERLGKEIEHMPARSDATVVYVTLALRYLEDPSGVQRAKELALELEDLGWHASQSAVGLKKIVAAHQLRKDEDLTQAIDSLNDGLAALKQSIPGLGDAYESAVTHTAQNWYQVVGESILDGLQKETHALVYSNTFPHSKFFDIWKRLDLAARYLSVDRRIGEIKQLLDRFSVGIGKTLLEDVNGLLDNTEDTLKHKIEKGGSVLGYLEIAFGERTSTAYKPISEEWSELEELVPILKESHTQWEKAWKALSESRQALKMLLVLSSQKEGIEMGEQHLSDSSSLWTWSRDVRNQPLQGISEIENKLSVVSEEMRGYIPSEFNRFNQFLAQFRQAITVITPGFQEFVQAVREEKHENALRLLKERLRGDRGNFENRLNELRKGAFDEALAATRLDPFYRLEDPMQAVEVVGLDALEKHLTMLLKNCSTWLEFSQDTTTRIRELVGRRNEARRYLTGGRLGDAVNLCREEIPDMFEEKESRNDIPRLLLDLKRKVAVDLPKMEAPLSMSALREAKPDEDFLTQTGGAVSAAFGELMEASRRDIKERWTVYLGLEICIGLMDLGPSMEGTEYPEGASRVWKAVWFEGLRKPMGMLEKPRQASLEELIGGRVKELEEAVREINRHLSRYTGDRIMERSQLDLRALIEKADRIDVKARPSKVAHEKYDQRQRHLAAKGK